MFLYAKAYTIFRLPENGNQDKTLGDQSSITSTKPVTAQIITRCEGNKAFITSCIFCHGSQWAWDHYYYGMMWGLVATIEHHLSV